MSNRSESRDFAPLVRVDSVCMVESSLVVFRPKCFFQFAACQMAPLRSSNPQNSDGVFCNGEEHAKDMGSTAEQQHANINGDFRTFVSQRTTIWPFVESLQGSLKAVQPTQGRHRSACGCSPIRAPQVLLGEPLNDDSVFHSGEPLARERLTSANASASGCPESDSSSEIASSNAARSSP